jgi:hypothetical protein
MKRVSLMLVKSSGLDQPGIKGGETGVVGVRMINLEAAEIARRGGLGVGRGSAIDYELKGLRCHTGMKLLPRSGLWREECFLNKCPVFYFLLSIVVKEYPSAVIIAFVSVRSR